MGAPLIRNVTDWTPTRSVACAVSAMDAPGVVVAGLIAFTAEPAEIDSSTMISIPLELVTIGDVTDIAAVSEDAKIEDEVKQEEVEPVASAAAPAPPPIEEDTVALDQPKKDPKKDEKKPKAKPDDKCTDCKDDRKDQPIAGLEIIRGVKKIDDKDVWDGGTIVERGSHDALLARHGIYAGLWAHQSGGFLTEDAA